MRIEQLPKEFKFKATADVRLNIVFLLRLIDQGFDVVGELDAFVSRYVVSGLVYAYSIEDNKIVVFLKGGNEDCYLKDPALEVFITDFDFDFGHSVPSNLDQAIDNQVLINDVIHLLGCLDPTSLSEKDICEINAIKLIVGKSQS